MNHLLIPDYEIKQSLRCTCLWVGKQTAHDTWLYEALVNEIPVCQLNALDT